MDQAKKIVGGQSFTIFGLMVFFGFFSGSRFQYFFFFGWKDEKNPGLTGYIEA